MFVLFQELHFLDLTGADEEECNFLQTTLFTRNPNLNYPELPWATHSDSSCTPAEWRPAPYGKKLTCIIHYAYHYIIFIYCNPFKYNFLLQSFNMFLHST
jgi:hypothetical protein